MALALTTHNSRLDRRDLLPLVLIALGFGLAVLVMPLSRDFAFIDDWAYIRPLENLVAGQGPAPSEYAQPTLVSQLYWGAAFAWLLGMNFTTTNVATMVLAVVAALVFYVLLRRTGFSPLFSSLGVALLTLNPYFINLAYSFMTDVPFLAWLLLSTLFYFEGLRSDNRSEMWLFLGSVFAAVAFLTRHFGLAPCIAALIWLLLARRLTWRRAAIVALLPMVSVAGYYAWAGQFGTSFASSISREEFRDMFFRPSVYVTRTAHFIYQSMLLPGVLVPLFGRVRHWKIVLPLSILVAAMIYIIWQVKYGLVADGTSDVNEFSYEWLRPLFADPTLIYCLGGALTVWLVAGIVERSWPGFVALVRRKRTPVPTDFLFILAIIYFAGTFIISAGFLDRYWLPLLPFLIAGGLVGLQGRPRYVLALPAVAAIFLGVYGSIIHLDMYDATRANWAAARSVVAQGVPYDKITAGYSWDGYQLYYLARERLPSLDIADIGRRFPPELVIDPEYIVSTAQPEGYDVVDSYPYFSRLGGFVTSRFYAFKRGD